MQKDKYTIREWRRLKEISQDDLANDLNVSRNTVANWEKKPEKIPAGKMLMIAEIFGVSIYEINLKAESE